MPRSIKYSCKLFDTKPVSTQNQKFHQITRFYPLRPISIYFPDPRMLHDIIPADTFRYAYCFQCRFLTIIHNIHPHLCQNFLLSTSTQLNLPPSMHAPVSHRIILFFKNIGFTGLKTESSQYFLFKYSVGICPTTMVPYRPS